MSKGISRNFKSFFHNEATGGILLLICAIISLLAANIPSLSFIGDFWNQYAGITIGEFSLKMSIGHWINDGLMAIFFFVVGLEIKREMLVGELSSIKHAALPIFGAIGGMIIPALIYLSFNYSDPESANGWGIPMATDIAFALGILSLLGKRAPLSLKVFLTALAIVDDLGAIIVLAIFYPSHALDLNMLMYAAGVVVILLLLNKYRVQNLLVYIVPGFFLWLFIYESGVHATISGVIAALTFPSKGVISDKTFYEQMKSLMISFKNSAEDNKAMLGNSEQKEAISLMSDTVYKATPLMHNLEHGLHPWVVWFIMPLFALANAGVQMTDDIFAFPPASVATGIFLGLLVGKPVGIFIFSWIAVKFNIAELPKGVKWSQVFSLGIIAGIGFTMSIFIDGLAFDSEEIANIGKAAILVTSLVAAIAGVVSIMITSPKTAQSDDSDN